MNVAARGPDRGSYYCLAAQGVVISENSIRPEWRPLDCMSGNRCFGRPRRGSALSRVGLLRLDIRVRAAERADNQKTSQNQRATEAAPMARIYRSLELA